MVRKLEEVEKKYFMTVPDGENISTQQLRRRKYEVIKLVHVFR